MIAVVGLLEPGQLVSNAGQQAVFITQVPHPLHAGMRLVIWRLADQTWSFDALLAAQETGEIVEPDDLRARLARLRHALRPGE